MWGKGNTTTTYSLELPVRLGFCANGEDSRVHAQTMETENQKQTCDIEPKTCAVSALRKRLRHSRPRGEHYLEIAIWKVSQ